jgi:hypothetical protein
LQFTGIECCRQTFEEQAPEQGREHVRKKGPRLARNPTLAIRRRARDILPKNIRLKLLFTIHITLVPENASSRSDELSTEVSFIL